MVESSPTMGCLNSTEELPQSQKRRSVVNIEDVNIYEKPGPSQPSNNVYDALNVPKTNFNDTYLLPDPKKPSNLASSVRDDKLIVAAIDFGTSNSGLGYGLRSEILSDPSKVYLVDIKDEAMYATKCPTTVLFDENKKFLMFGFEAERYYSENPDDKNLNKMYMFRNFKMKLYNNKTLSRDTQLYDITGDKSLPAIDVFAAVIKFFKDLLWHRLEEKEENMKTMTSKDVFWVITVPAIWDLKARQFMTESAEKAGLEMDRFALALEPEVASLTSREISVNCRSVLHKGANYLVVDVGGGTVDITAHKILEDGGLEELHHAYGGPWGGMSVNQRFDEFIRDIFGNDIVNEIAKLHTGNLLKFMTDFERKKCYFSNKERLTDSKVVMNIPPIFSEVIMSKSGVSLEDKIKQSNSRYANKVKYTRGKLYMETEVFSALFNDSLVGITSSTENVLSSERLKDVNVIILVGGYAQCNVLQEAVRLEFKEKRVIIPEDPQHAVLKGAVMFGFRPSSISSRVCGYTYGIAKQVPFNPDIHPNNKKVRIGRREYCDDVFDIHVQKGELMEINVYQPEQEYMTTVRNQKHACLELYASTDKSPSFVTDESCQFIGIMQIDLCQDDDEVKDLLFVRMNLSGTNIEIEAKEKKSGRVTRATCNFLG